MIINNLGESQSLLNQFVSEIRDSEIQQDRMRFRRNLERVGEIFAYEISKELEYKKQQVKTPLGTATVPRLSDYPVLATILRAGLPFHQGFLSYFDKSGNAFISAYRKHSNNEDFVIQIDYASGPDLSDKVLILSDPMLATALSMVDTYKKLLEKGKPKYTHIVALIATQQGVKYVEKHLGSEKITLWVGAIDNELTPSSYIVPGLGDAGDLAFGSKL